MGELSLRRAGRGRPIVKNLGALALHCDAGLRRRGVSRSCLQDRVNGDQGRCTRFAYTAD